VSDILPILDIDTALWGTVYQSAVEVSN